MNPSILPASPSLAAAITKAASKQTYYTICFLSDRDRMEDAYRAYAYFRWVDDTLDGETISAPERMAFLNRQGALLDACYRGDVRENVCPEERILVDLVQRDGAKHSGLQYYLRNMMAVMAFDARRRGRLISQFELDEYTRRLAGAVTEAMHYFIGHCGHSPRNKVRYLAVSAAHITHMLRDTLDDIQAGYYNIPGEVLEAGQISPDDVTSHAYRSWVRSRVQLARDYFRIGRDYLGQVENLRCRLAGYAYMARFEGVLDAIEQEDFALRPSYAECKGLGAIVRAGRFMLPAFIFALAERLTSPGNSTQPDIQVKP